MNSSVKQKKRQKFAVKRPSGLDLAFEVSVSIDKDIGDIRAASLMIRKGKIAATKEVIPGRLFADYDEQDRLLEIEILSPVEIGSLHRLLRDEPAEVRRFVMSCVPSGFLSSIVQSL